MESNVTEKENKYQSALSSMNSGNPLAVKIALNTFDQLGDYKDSLTNWKMARYRLRTLEKRSPNEWKELDYQDALQYLNDQKSQVSQQKAEIILSSLGRYKDAEILRKKIVNKSDQIVIYSNAKKLAESNTIKDLREAVRLLKTLDGYKDSDQLIKEYRRNIKEIQNASSYQRALKKAKSENVLDLNSAIATFEKLKDYKDSTEQIEVLKVRIQELEEKAKQDRLRREKKEAAEKLLAEKKRKAEITRNNAVAPPNSQLENTVVAEARQSVSNTKGVQIKQKNNSKSKIIKTLIFFSVVFLCAIKIGVAMKQEQQEKLAEANRITEAHKAIDATIMQWVKPIVDQYGITDLSVNVNKIDYDYYEQEGECKQYYFTSEKFETLSDFKKLDALEALYEKLCPIGKDLYYVAPFGTYIDTGTVSYSLFVNQGNVSLIEGNIVSSSITRSSDYSARQDEFLGLGKSNNLSNTSTSSQEKVTCSMCNGTGRVKYYYGESNSAYNWGPCTSCDGKGYTMMIPKGNSNNGKNVICPGCGRYVDKLVSRKDKAGVTRRWCRNCWKEYDDIMG